MREHWLRQVAPEVVKAADEIRTLLTQGYPRQSRLKVAGAGTGKTSVMVGRAGYLIKSAQAQASEILMLAFANKAAAEMQERIDHRLGKCGITASTFHKLGKEIIAKVEGQQPSLTPLAEDDKALALQVSQWFEEHLKAPVYQQLAIKYFKHHLYPAVNPFDFDSEGEYFDYILANDIRTLKGEVVKSLGECLLANYLFRQGIEYQYEPAYEHRTASPLYRQYQPDFYLPEHGIYIEYYGIDREGNTAPYVDHEKYHQGMDWKRQFHAEKGTRLIELYHYELHEGVLFDTLDAQLAELNVDYQPLPPEAVLATLREFGATKVTALDLTFRFNSGISDVATGFVLQNPVQIQKQLNTLEKVKHPTVSLLRADNRPSRALRSQVVWKK